jgi:hypothetical protein
MSKITIEERLNEIISDKDDKIEALERQVENLTADLNYANHAWQHHFAFQNDEFFKQMPFPRLEMRLRRLSKDSWYSIEWVYGLVYKHAIDTFGEDNDTLRFIPISKTTSNGGRGTVDNWCKDGKLNLPFRDSLHIHAESKIFNLPAFIICEEIGVINKIERQTDNSEVLSKMKSDGTRERHTITS